ncbi:RNA polymerase sigma factor [Paenibacillus mendelii]|uniref:RNA polymerase sigma factor n=1 Tax=Paenibacillus mendelii TaxID=206163 RepID=A0ABV6JHY2_9BACL|nr:sigma-70 family RNA polymerase sigma factor [Paenibacillus mendelii]MCQ6558397.1 sigma-70 family RNA polymerase sigma factor [Paenibacillus mendelii]
MDVSIKVQEAVNGARDAFIQLIRANEQSMYAVARGILKSDSDAADAIQETILKAYNGIRGLREPAYFRTWLIRILINECRQIARHNSKFIPMTGVVEREDVHGFESSMEVDELLGELDLEHKEIVVLYYMEDMSVKEIAQSLDISEGTVKSRLYRARLKLAILLKETEPGVVLQ